MSSETTKLEIEMAIVRILQGKPTRIANERRLSIAAVAEEAGVSNATIHNRYPVLAEQIRRILKDGREAFIGEQNTQVANLHRQLAEIRKALRKREDEIRRLKIINVLLAKEIQALRDELEDPVSPGSRTNFGNVSTT